MPLNDRPLEEAVYDSPPQRMKGEVRPESVQPTSTSPAPSSSAPGFGGTSGEDTAPEPEAAPPPEFDPRWRDDFTGLVHIGALTDRFEWLGHQFHIRTLTTEELAEIALVTKKYLGSGAEDKVWQAAVTAACVISVDGKALPAPLTTEPGDTEFSNKFHYVFGKWYAPTLDVVFERYMSLEIKVREVIAAMGKASG